MMIQRTKIQIRWADIDQLGHLYNGRYQHLFDIGKSDYFETILGMDPNWAISGEGFLTVRTLNNYYSPVEMHEAIEVETYIGSVGTKSFVVHQRMINGESGELKSDSESVLVCYNPIVKQTYEVPCKVREAVRK